MYLTCDKLRAYSHDRHQSENPADIWRGHFQDIRSFLLVFLSVEKGWCSDWIWVGAESLHVNSLRTDGDFCHRGRDIEMTHKTGLFDGWTLEAKKMQRHHIRSHTLRFLTSVKTHNGTSWAWFKRCEVCGDSLLQARNEIPKNSAHAH
jgi:hypothetical protein